MPYTAKNLPARIKKKGAKTRRQWMHVWNNTYKKTGDEGKAFAAANGVVKGKKELDDMAKPMQVVAGEKSVKVTLFSGADDPDLPAHVKALPVGVRSRWVNTYNWGVMDTQDDEDAQEQADSYTTMSVDDVSELLGVSSKEAAASQAPASPSSQAGEVAARFPRLPVGEVGQRVLPQSPSWVQRLKAWISKDDTEGEGAPIKPGVFTVYKGSDGRLRVFTVYSNNFKDSHKQIIRASAHEEYAQAAEAGQALYPDLHLWHGGPDTKWGTVETVSVVAGFAIAGGIVDEGKEEVAYTLKEMADKGEIAVSYGFYGLLAPDESYLLYRPFEISPLPATNESNPWTAMDFKENRMAFSDKKKTWLKEHFKMGDEQIAAAEKSFESMAGALKAAGVEYKEEGETPTPTPTPPQPTPPDPPPTPPPPSPAAGEPLIAMLTGMAKAIEGLGEQVKALKEGQPAAVAAAANDQIMARVAGGAGFSPTRDPGNVQTGMKEQEADWFGDLLKNTAVSAFMPATGGGSNGSSGGAVVAAVPQPTAAPANGEVR